MSSSASLLLAEEVEGEAKEHVDSGIGCYLIIAYRKCRSQFSDDGRKQRNVRNDEERGRELLGLSLLCTGDRPLTDFNFLC